MIRFFDIIFSIIGLVILSPIFIVLYILIVLYFLYKIIKHNFSFDKTEKANDEIITKIVKSFIREV